MNNLEKTGYRTIKELQQQFLLLTDSDLLLLEKNMQDEILNKLHKKPDQIKGKKKQNYAQA